LFSDDEDTEVKTKTVRRTSLHLAMSNNRSVNIILQYMAKIDANCCESIKDLLP